MLGKVFTVVGFMIIGLLLAAIVAAPGAWLLMILLGAFANVSGLESWALGFWSCYIAVVIITIFFGGAGSARSKK